MSELGVWAREMTLESDDLDIEAARIEQDLKRLGYEPTSFPSPGPSIRLIHLLHGERHCLVALTLQGSDGLEQQLHSLIPGSEIFVITPGDIDPVIALESIYRDDPWPPPNVALSDLPTLIEDELPRLRRRLGLTLGMERPFEALLELESVLVDLHGRNADGVARALCFVAGEAARRALPDVWIWAWLEGGARLDHGTTFPVLSGYDADLSASDLAYTSYERPGGTSLVEQVRVFCEPRGTAPAVGIDKLPRWAAATASAVGAGLLAVSVLIILFKQC